MSIITESLNLTIHYLKKLRAHIVRKINNAFQALQNKIFLEEDRSDVAFWREIFFERESDLKWHEKNWNSKNRKKLN